MNKMLPSFAMISMLVAACVAQRPFYARRPVGYPVIEASTEGTESNDLGNRFGTGQTTTSTTTQRLPIEALGDRELVDRLSNLPTDQQPFWLLNWRALEQHRQQRPTFQHRHSNFIIGSATFNSPQTD